MSVLRPLTVPAPSPDLETSPYPCVTDLTDAQGEGVGVPEAVSEDEQVGRDSSAHKDLGAKADHPRSCPRHAGEPSQDAAKGGSSSPLIVLGNAAPSPTSWPVVAAGRPTKTPPHRDTTRHPPQLFGPVADRLSATGPPHNQQQFHLPAVKPPEAVHVPPKSMPQCTHHDELVAALEALGVASNPNTSSSSCDSLFPVNVSPPMLRPPRLMALTPHASQPGPMTGEESGASSEQRLRLHRAMSSMRPPPLPLPPLMMMHQPWVRFLPTGIQANPMLRISQVFPPRSLSDALPHPTQPPLAAAAAAAPPQPPAAATAETDSQQQHQPADSNSVPSPVTAAKPERILAPSDGIHKQETRASTSNELTPSLWGLVGDKGASEEGRRTPDTGRDDGDAAGSQVGGSTPQASPAGVGEGTEEILRMERELQQKLPMIEKVVSPEFMQFILTAMFQLQAAKLNGKHTDEVELRQAEDLLHEIIEGISRADDTKTAAIRATMGSGNGNASASASQPATKPSPSQADGQPVAQSTPVQQQPKPQPLPLPQPPPQRTTTAPASLSLPPSFDCQPTSPGGAGASPFPSPFPRAPSLGQPDPFSPAHFPPVAESPFGGNGREKHPFGFPSLDGGPPSPTAFDPPPFSSPRNEGGGMLGESGRESSYVSPNSSLASIGRQQWCEAANGSGNASGTAGGSGGSSNGDEVLSEGAGVLRVVSAKKGWDYYVRKTPVVLGCASRAQQGVRVDVDLGDDRRLDSRHVVIRWDSQSSWGRPEGRGTFWLKNVGATPIWMGNSVLTNLSPELALHDEGTISIAGDQLHITWQPQAPASLPPVSLDAIVPFPPKPSRSSKERSLPLQANPLPRAAPIEILDFQTFMMGMAHQEAAAAGQAATRHMPMFSHSEAAPPPLSPPMSLGSSAMGPASPNPATGNARARCKRGSCRAKKARSTAAADADGLYQSPAPKKRGRPRKRQRLDDDDPMQMGDDMNPPGHVLENERPAKGRKQANGSSSGRKATAARNDELELFEDTGSHAASSEVSHELRRSSRRRKRRFIDADNDEWEVGPEWAVGHHHELHQQHAYDPYATMPYHQPPGKVLTDTPAPDVTPSPPAKATSSAKRKHRRRKRDQHEEDEMSPSHPGHQHQHQADPYAATEVAYHGHHGYTPTGMAVAGGYGATDPHGHHPYLHQGVDYSSSGLQPWESGVGMEGMEGEEEMGMEAGMEADDDDDDGGGYGGWM
ncbi:unnamed protein product [Vitrella brassicaformis CCMP3155]|uniref:FHA domain-containing protein n=1 Tax=Vitrella brassicaformis (strain CCMP3155) TaxID=1169540 RepID=A0A0G4FT51_VITBC|nr:unnamed protein product [Vitrella brassicaformis CCMP3155]|eukprot:CEM17863.1 unnamed protein product [Vitrella brassicaformis CCMP3155]